MSLVEAMVNVVVGYAVAVITQMLVFPLFGLETTIAQDLTIGLIFTLVSLVRSGALRRAFDSGPLGPLETAPQPRDHAGTAALTPTRRPTATLKREVC